MKKIIAIAMIIALTFSLLLTVNAATGLNEHEKEVLTALKTKEVLGKNGWKFFIPTEYVAAAENYFNTIDMTEAQKDKILSYIDKGADIVKAEGDKADFDGEIYNLKTMSYEAKQQVLDLGQKACAEVNLTLTYAPAENKVIIKDANGKVAFENTPIIKTTGEEFDLTTACVVSVSVVVLGGVVALFVISKKKGLFVK